MDSIDMGQHGGLIAGAAGLLAVLAGLAASIFGFLLSWRKGSADASARIMEGFDSVNKRQQEQLDRQEKRIVEVEARCKTAEDNHAKCVDESAKMRNENIELRRKIQTLVDKTDMLERKALAP